MSVDRFDSLPTATVWARLSTSPFLLWVAQGLTLGCLVGPDLGVPGWFLLGIAGPPLALLALLSARFATVPVLQRVTIMCLSVFIGLAAAQAPEREPQPQWLELDGQVERVFFQGFGQAFLLHNANENTPSMLRVMGPGSPIIAEGDVVRVRGLLTQEHSPYGERLTLRASEMQLVQLRELSARQFAWQVIERLPRHNSLAQTLLLGQGRPVSRDAFHQAGLLHVLAVSGLHLGIALAGVVFVLRVLSIPWLWRLLLTALAALAYAWLTGWNLPTQRALAMTLALLVFAWSQRAAHPLAPFSLAVIALLCIDPSHARSIGFQLSAGAVLGIITLGRDLMTLRQRHLPLKPWPLDRPSWRLILLTCRGVCDGLCVDVSAGLVLAPITATYFNEFTPWSPLASVVVVPSLMLILGAGLLLLVCSALWMQGPWQGLYVLVDWGLESLQRIVAAVPHIMPGSLSHIEPPSLWLLCLWPLLLLPMPDNRSLGYRVLGCAALIVFFW